MGVFVALWAESEITDTGRPGSKREYKHKPVYKYKCVLYIGYLLCVRVGRERVREEENDWEDSY